MLRVRLLGELQADVDGAPSRRPPSRRAWSLLAWLALHPGEHARGAVAARFWPDVLDTSARASLRSALWALRRASGATTRWSPAATGSRCGARPTSPRSTRTSRAGRLEDAVALHRGPLLADLDEDWVLEARDEHARARRRRAGAARRDGADARPTPSAARAAGSRSTRSTRTPRAS